LILFRFILKSGTAAFWAAEIQNLPLKHFSFVFMRLPHEFVRKRDPAARLPSLFVDYRRLGASLDMSRRRSSARPHSLLADHRRPHLWLVELSGGRWPIEEQNTLFSPQRFFQAAAITARSIRDVLAGECTSWPTPGSRDLHAHNACRQSWRYPT
jgi:hypothetical protein